MLVQRYLHNQLWGWAQRPHLVRDVTVALEIQQVLARSLMRDGPASAWIPSGELKSGESPLGHRALAASTWPPAVRKVTEFHRIGHG